MGSIDLYSKKKKKVHLSYQRELSSNNRPEKLLSDYVTIESFFVTFGFHCEGESGVTFLDGRFWKNKQK